MHVTVDDISFCDGLECVYIMNKNRASTAVNCLINTWIFAGYKWLLIACDKAFNATKVVYRFYCMPLYNFQTRRHVIQVSIRYFNGLGFCESFMLFLSCFVMLSCTSVCLCLVVTCWERADLLALVCDI